ncbi:peptidase [Bacillus xiamenensis]|uniref:Chitobiase/beta-hexosaminidase C-terminal domain-containing protein n=1 Tax=Bacillus xiamenensis TaxID=1178537 RepID=A0AAC9IFZ6_9BACI|nr:MULTISPECIES: chitobiase/beta-hexosaminidase C-terminal domain-containing protein [Bacillus]AOZ88925.1 peptidase [Bacillus xiamenensis]MBG9910225.1 peptidase [Bacillus xiamenensis]MCY9575143.1 chitobiase/beta-hexosaminidase C-terminal domain-containing protein [Bacillus xiamenensis]QGX64363.1 peptidase [Bacillus sp. ms-22]
MNHTTKKYLITFIIFLFSMSFLYPSVSSARTQHTSFFKPTASVPSGEYYRSQEVTLHSPVRKASLYYTTDGSQPTAQSQLYNKPIHIDSDTTLKVSVYKNKKHLATSTYNYRFVTREDIASSFLSFEYEGMPYRLYIPKDRKQGKSYPLVLFLHGGGERGTDNQKQLLANDGAVLWASPEVQRKHPSYVLAPQARNAVDGGFALTRNSQNEIDLTNVFQFSPDLRKAYEVLQHVIASYRIDQKRIYSTGLSQGGFGSYQLNITYPRLFAAMIPIAGGADPSKAGILAHKPIWAFHAEDDSIIPVSYARNTIQAIQKAGGHPLYTEYASKYGYDHASWTPAYETPGLTDWLFAQRLSFR